MPPSVLCVDDDRNLCGILARALAAEGLEVRVAHDGDSALRSARSDPPDLLLLDVLLPRRDGFEVLEALRSGGGPAASVPAVFFSGCSGTRAYEERATRLGAQALLTKPVALERLTEVIRKALGTEAPVDPRARARQLLVGSLAELPLPALLHHLHGLRANGVLELCSGRKRKGIQLRDGRPVAVSSNLLPECLGNLLVRQGRIGQREFEESVQRMRRGEGLQGQILVAMDLLDEEELTEVLRQQAEQKLFEVFSWRNGEFRFRRGARLARGNALAVDRSPANLILTGIRSWTPLEQVDRALGARAKRFVVLGQSPFYRFQEIDLDAAGAALLDELGASPQLSELLTRDEATRRTLYGLLATELIELRVAPTPSPAPALAAAGRRPAAPAAASTSHHDAMREQELAAFAERIRGRDYYAVLGVAPGADEEQIRKAYESVAHWTHPDRFRDASDAIQRLAEEVFGIVSRAHETLADQARGQASAADPREAAEIEAGQRALQAELRFREGERLLRKRDYTSALRCFEEAVEIYPDEGEYHTYLGWALHLTRPDDKATSKAALLHIRRGRKLAPDREKPYLFLGRLHRAAGRSKSAEKCFTRALQIDPDCVEAMRELRLIDMRRERSKGLLGRWLRR